MNIRKHILTAALLVCASAYASAAAMKMTSGTVTYADKNGKTVTLTATDGNPVTIPEGVAITVVGGPAEMLIGSKQVSAPADARFAWNGKDLSVTAGEIILKTANSLVAKAVRPGQTAVILDVVRSNQATSFLASVTVVKTNATNNALQDVQTTQNNNPVSPSAP